MVDRGVRRRAAVNTETAPKMDSLPTPTAPASALEIAETLHKIPALLETWTRCGKANCRCARGELHGPYHALHWREGALQRRRYVRPADLAGVRSTVERRRTERAMLRAERAEAASLLRALKALYRELDRGGMR